MLLLEVISSWNEQHVLVELISHVTVVQLDVQMTVMFKRQLQSCPSWV